MAQLLDAQQSVPGSRVSSSDDARREAPRRYALAVDLGSGALKLGIVSLTGEIVAVDQASLETERLTGGGAVQDARSLVGCGPHAARGRSSPRYP